MTIKETARSLGLLGTGYSETCRIWPTRAGFSATTAGVLAFARAAGVELFLTAGEGSGVERHAAIVAVMASRKPEGAIDRFSYSVAHFQDSLKLVFGQRHHRQTRLLNQK